MGPCHGGVKDTESVPHLSLSRLLEDRAITISTAELSDSRQRVVNYISRQPGPAWQAVWSAVGEVWPSPMSPGPSALPHVPVFQHSHHQIFQLFWSDGPSCKMSLQTPSIESVASQ